MTFGFGGVVQILLMTAIMTPLTYFAAAVNLPTRDASLFAVDRALGFNWLAYASFVNGHPALAAWLNFGYAMIRWPIFAMPVVLAAMGRYRRVEEFTFAFGAALIVTTLVSALLPAIGVYHEAGLDPSTLKHINPAAYLAQLHALPASAEGALRQLRVSELGGMATFPSFYAACAVLCVWALWPARFLRPLLLLVGGLMLAAAALDGGHYLIGLIGGMAVAAMAIALARSIDVSIGRKRRVGLAVPRPVHAV